MTRLDTTIACVVFLAALLGAAYGAPPIIPKMHDTSVKTRGILPTVPGTRPTADDGGLLITIADIADWGPVQVSNSNECLVDIEFVLDGSGSISSAEWVLMKTAVSR
jgi:hypothetical protein